MSDRGPLEYIAFILEKSPAPESLQWPVSYDLIVPFEAVLSLLTLRLRLFAGVLLASLGFFWRVWRSSALFSTSVYESVM